MKVKELILRNYKRFSDTHPPLSFCDEWGEPLDMVLLVGENGCGKSSVLQAIAAVVGGAVRPDMQPADLNWPGFDYRHIQSGRREIEMKALLHFGDDEIEATREYAQRVQAQFPNRPHIEPGHEHTIWYNLGYSDNRVFAPNRNLFFQAQGYQYALQLRRFEVDYNKLFDRVGSIYWYTEQRNSASIMINQGGQKALDASIARVNDDELRKLLSKWYRFHREAQRRNWELRPGQRDVFVELNRMYGQIFPGRNLEGSAPRMGPEEILEDVEDFFLCENGKEYEVSGMSGGERAIFPLLIDFANWNINNSIILIDEVGLHLHPPLQQALIRALPKLGKNNQFIMTTHSDDVASMFQAHQIIRLDQYEQAPVS